MPQSQTQGIELAQQLLVPLQAQVALISGKYAGNSLALKFYLDAEVIMCEQCKKTLTKSGGGHNTDCELYQKALEVLESDEGECEKNLLLAEQSKLVTRLDRLAKKVATIDARKS